MEQDLGIMLLQAIRQETKLWVQIPNLRKTYKQSGSNTDTFPKWNVLWKFETWGSRIMVCSVKYKHNADIGKWKIMIEQKLAMQRRQSPFNGGKDNKYRNERSIRSYSTMF